MEDKLFNDGRDPLCKDEMPFQEDQRLIVGFELADELTKCSRYDPLRDES